MVVIIEISNQNTDIYGRNKQTLKTINDICSLLNKNAYIKLTLAS